MKTLRVALVCLGALSGIANEGSAQQASSARAQAIAEIQAEIDRSSPGEEFHRSQGTTDALEKGKTARFRFDAAPETEYAIVGACDENCSEFDLFIFDESDNLVGADQGGGSPMVMVAANAGKALTIRVDMVDCDESPCSFGVGIYEKPASDRDSNRRAYEAAQQLFQ